MGRESGIVLHSALEKREGEKWHQTALEDPSVIRIYIYIYYRDLKNITGEAFGFTGGSVQLEKVDQKYFFPKVNAQSAKHICLE